jgi:ribosomal protein S18 acetylase RimI-like enzyme
MEIQIRKASSNEWLSLQATGRQTFQETFADSNTEENMAKYLEEGFAEDKLIKELNNPGSEFYFALNADQVIGYLKLNYGQAQTELNDNQSLEIERIYVLKSYQGKNIGQLLFNKALEIAQEAKVDYIWLGVWEENHRAVQLYQKNVFLPFDKHIFRLGEEEQTDILMKRYLSDNQSILASNQFGA